MTAANQLAGYASSLPNFRNRIINGNFDIWQRGTSQTSTGYGSADRWNFAHSGSSSKTASQQAFTVGQTEVPGNPKYYLRHVITTGGTSNDWVKISQRIEGASTLAGKTATFSFWAKADANKNIATEYVRNYGTGGSPSSSTNTIGVTTHNLTTSWQKFTTTVSIPHMTDTGLAGGTPLTIGTDGNDSMRADFWLDAGSTFNSRTNSLGNQSGTFDIAQVQLEEGTVATPFEHRPYGMEISLCQRYFEKSYNIEDSPGTNTYNGVHSNGGFYAMPSSNYGTRVHAKYKVTKRGSAAVTTYDSAGNPGKCNYPDSATNQSLTVIHSGQTGFTAETSSLSNSTDTRCYWHWTSSSEL